MRPALDRQGPPTTVQCFGDDDDLARRLTEAIRSKFERGAFPEGVARRLIRLMGDCAAPGQSWRACDLSCKYDRDFHEHVRLEERVLFPRFAWKGDP